MDAYRRARAVLTSTWLGTGAGLTRADVDDMSLDEIDDEYGMVRKAWDAQARMLRSIFRRR